MDIAVTHHKTKVVHRGSNLVWPQGSSKLHKQVVQVPIPPTFIALMPHFAPMTK